MKTLAWLLFFLCVSLLSLMKGNKYLVERRMGSLCRSDGGIRVYEKVILPKNMFDEYGNPFPGWQQRSVKNLLGHEYLYDDEYEALNNGQPELGGTSLIRHDQKIIRRADGQLLAEKIYYSSYGGDISLLIGFESTVNTCPSRKEEQQLIRSVFVKGA
ncbi:hypothetical protein [Solimonas marina]|uniref:Uncharacterized protein n=1 Tax=Solimonas marina TaxID=2714601 RepID=A0A969WC68_9GAMM|nr:hypothetical protein [Solimonas marina]NKF23343.1 hypothetical protein [Solimonas marina]